MTGTERKVFQKYYPPDFDPSKIPKAKGGRNRQFVQRVMTPCNMRCDTCHEYIYKGKKFNMRRETAEGEYYLGLRLFRFYFRCPNCLAEITFKTGHSPQKHYHHTCAQDGGKVQEIYLENCDYQLEQGATRLFEAAKAYQNMEKEKEEKEEEDKKNPMKMLEKRTKMSRAEMEALGKLEELREMNRQAAGVSEDDILANLFGEDLSEAERIRRQELEDEQFVQSIFGKNTDDKSKIIKRLPDEDEDNNFSALPGPSSSQISSLDPQKLGAKTQNMGPPAVPNANAEKSQSSKKRPQQTSQKDILKNSVVVKKKPKVDVEVKNTEVIEDKKAEKCASDKKSNSGALAGLSAYSGSSSSDDE